jgi:hypothetical protein
MQTCTAGTKLCHCATFFYTSSSTILVRAFNNLSIESYMKPGMLFESLKSLMVLLT